MNSKSKALVVLFVILSCTVAMLVIWNLWHTEEGFDGATAAVPTGSSASSVPIDSSTPITPPTTTTFFQGTTIPVSSTKRPCAIYYGSPSNIGICDNYQYMYTLPPERLSTMAAGPDSTVVKIIQAELQGGKLPGVNNNMCKLQFDNPWTSNNGYGPPPETTNTAGTLLSWSEPTTSVDGQNIIYKKIVQDQRITKYGDPVNWGHCYQPLQSRAANTVTGLVADGANIYGTPNTASPYQDDQSSSYAEIAFSSFAWSNLKAPFCNKFQKAKPANMPDILFAFKFDSTQPIIRDVKIVSYVSDTTTNPPQLQSLTSDPSTFYDQLYTLQINQDKHVLELKPKELIAYICTLYWDECNRISQVDKFVPRGSTLSLAIADIQPQLLYGPVPGDLAYNLEYADARALLASKQNELTTANNTVTADVNNVTYVQGIMISEFRPFVSSSINSSDGITGAISGLRSGPPSGTSIKQAVQGAGAQFFSSGGNANTYYELDGYVLAPVTGTYYFNIVASGPADISINGKLHFLNGLFTVTDGQYVASTFGQQPSGVQVTANTYIPICIRLCNGNILPSLNLYWNAGDPKAKWSYVPQNAVYYNSGLSNYAAAYAAQQALQNKVNNLKTYLDYVDKARHDTFNASLVGKTITAFPPSMMFSGLIPKDPTSRWMFINFPGVLNNFNDPYPYNTLQHFTDGPQAWANSQALPAGLDPYKLPVVYTVFVRVWIDQESTSTRNVFLVGETMADQAPALFVQSSNNGSAMSLNHATTLRDDIGELGYYTWHPTTFGYWFVYTAVVNRDTITMYYNGDNAQTTSLPVGEEFVWNYKSKFMPTNKKVYLTYMNNTPAADGRLQIRDFQWFDTALDQATISTIAANILATPV